MANNLGVSTYTVGGDYDLWGDKIVADLAILNKFAGDTHTVSDTTGTVTLTTTQCQNFSIKANGSGASQVDIRVPNTIARYWYVRNDRASGSITVRCAAGGTSVTMTAGERRLVYSDGTNCVDLTLATIAIASVTGLQAALDAKAALASPTFTGTPAAPTAAPGTNTTQIASTAFVKAAIDVILGGVAAQGDTLAELYALIGSLTTTVAGKLAAADVASTTDAQTGTDAAKYITSDALAALWEKGADIASAATISLGEGGFYHVTGTTTITDIDWTTAKDGRGAWVVFDDILTLTYNATTLKLPGSANITTAAGDRAYFVQDSSDNVICLAYVRADGTAVTGGGMTLLGTLTTTSGSTQSLTSIPSGYRELYFVFGGVRAAAAANLQIALSSTNGAAYGTAVTVAAGSGGAAGTWYGFIRVGNISSAVDIGKTAFCCVTMGGADPTVASIALATNTAAAVNAVRFSVVGGSSAFDAGSITIWGVK